jgi:hypothetical protein
MRSFSILAVMFSAVAILGAETCPNPPVPSISTATMPSDVCIPQGFTDLSIDFFDDYSWRAFVAAVWPAGKQALDGPGPRTFETYKPLWEIFHEDGSAPGNAPEYNACSAKVETGDLVFASSSGLGDIGQQGDGSLVAPLAAQNGRYVRYLTAYNQIAYDHIVKNQWYLRSHLPVVPVPRPAVPPVQFPDGSIVVKSAWVEMSGFPQAQRERFYTRTAIVLDPHTRKCARETVGLVGLHIIQKTASRPQWIWSSFEQVDNVPPAEPGLPGKFTFHDGSDAPMPDRNPLALLPLAAEPVTPFNVVRSPRWQIHPRTRVANTRYRQLLESTVWRNYQLVVTQWPLAPGDQSVPVPASQAGDVFQTFPGDAATSAFANVTMETFTQSRPAQGCMNCHNRVRLTADFMWSVFEHAYPAKITLSEH